MIPDYIIMRGYFEFYNPENFIKEKPNYKLSK